MKLDGELVGWELRLVVKKIDGRIHTLHPQPYLLWIYSRTQNKGPCYGHGWRDVDSCWLKLKWRDFPPEVLQVPGIPTSRLLAVAHLVLDIRAPWPMGSPSHRMACPVVSPNSGHDSVRIMLTPEKPRWLQVAPWTRLMLVMWMLHDGYATMLNDGQWSLNGWFVIMVNNPQILW